VLIATLFDSTEIPALPHDSFAADPIADLDCVALLKITLENELACTTAPLTMQLEPTPTNRSIGEQYRSPYWRGTVM